MAMFISLREGWRVNVGGNGGVEERDGDVKEAREVVIERDVLGTEGMLLQFRDREVKF